MNVLAEACTALYHHGIAHTCAGVGNHTRREYHSVANLAVAGNLRTISEDVHLSYLGIVRYVHTLHEEVAVADDRLAVAERGAVYHHVLADDVLVADNKLRGIATVVEVLRLGTKHCVLEHLVPVAQPCTVHDAHVRIDHAVVTNHNVILDICKGVDGHVVSNLCPWAYQSLVTNVAHNCLRLASPPTPLQKRGEIGSLTPDPSPKERGARWSCRVRLL